MAQIKLWGHEVKASGLKDLFAPQEVKAFAINAAGIDNLSLSSIDTFLIPNRGEYKVDFDGFFRVAREQATSKEWASAEVYVNMVEINLKGKSNELGDISVRINPDYVSAGQVFASLTANDAKACRIPASVIFEIHGMNLTLFNKEPILLMNNAIKSVPPVEDPKGVAHIFYLPLYDHNSPNDKPMAYLKTLHYTVGNYLTRDEIAKLKERK